MAGGQKRTVICGCGKHIKGSLREVASRAKIHAKVCDLLDVSDLNLPFEAGMNGLGGIDVSRRGNLQQRRQLTGVVTEEGKELFRDDVNLVRLICGLQQRGIDVEIHHV